MKIRNAQNIDFHVDNVKFEKDESITARIIDMLSNNRTVDYFSMLYTTT